MTAEGTPRRKGRTLRRWLALPLAAGFLLALAAPAHATFPGDNGKIVFADLFSVNNSEKQIWTMNADGTDLTPLTSDGNNRDPEWSADGRKIVFRHEQGTNDVVTVMNGDGTGRVDVLTKSLAIQPAWSPTGDKIAYARLADGIWLVNADGTGDVKLAAPLTGSGTASNPDWSPDGTKIVYEWYSGAAAGNDRGIGIIDVATGNSSFIAGGPGAGFGFASPEWSPDGTKVFFFGSGGISTVNADGTGLAPLSTQTVGNFPAPSPDGTKLAYREGGGTLALANPDGSSQTQIPGPVSGDNADWGVVPQEPDLEPINITKLAFSQGVEGHWTWRMGKWTTSKLEQKATGPRPYNFRVLVDSHGFKPTKWKMRVRVLLNNPNDVAVPGTLADVLPGWNCSLPFPRPFNLGAGSSLSATFDCSTGTDPSGPVTNTATFTPEASTGLGPVSDQATTTIDETPPPNSPGQKVALRDPMWHGGTKVLRHLDAVGGPASITASYTVKLIPPATPGKCWWHHNTAHLQDVATGKKILKSNRVSVYLCRPKDAPKGKDPKKLPKVGKDGIPIVTPKLGGPKVIPAKYRTRLRTSVRAPRAVFRGQAFRALIRTRNMTRKRAFGTIVKVKVPKGMRVATKQRGIRTKGRFAYWTVKALGPRKSIRRSLKLVAIRPGTKRIIAISNARNAKRSKGATRVRVLRPRRVVS